MCQWNCRGFGAHYATLLEVARCDAVHVFVLQETVLQENTTVTLPGYRVFHCPRPGRAGGGLAILARYSLNCRLVPHPVSCGDEVEVQTVTLHLPNFVMWLYNIYRPPTADLDLRELFGLAATDIILVVGDLKAHHQWVSSPRPDNPAGRSLHAAYLDSGNVSLKNDITSPPMHVRGGRLDLAFASTRFLPVPTWSLHPYLSSDHCGIILDMTVSLTPPPSRPLSFNMRQADWGKFMDVAEGLIRDADLAPP